MKRRVLLPIDKCIAYRCNVRLRGVQAYSTGVKEKPVIQVIILEVRSGEVSGFGEFCPTSANYAPGIRGTSSLAEWDEILASSESLLGKNALDLRSLIPPKYRGVADANGIVDCLDIALHDLVGKAKEIPCWALAGGRRRSAVPAMPVIHTDEIGNMVDKASRWQKQWGLRLFKLKPHADFDTDIKMMMQFSATLAPGTKFLLDANYAYKNVEEAAETLAATSKFGVFLAEDPVETDYQTLKQKLKPELNQSGVQLMLDQQARTIADVYEIATCGCADVINFHANWHSGVSGLLEKAVVVETAGMKNFVGSSAYIGIADAANIALAAMLPSLVACEQVRGADFYIDGDEVVDDFYPLVDGHYRLPDAPGWGVEVNRRKLERITVERVVIG